MSCTGSLVNQENCFPKLSQNGRNMAGMHKKLINIIFGKYFVGSLKNPKGFSHNTNPY
jgi:hypothetical protein